MPEVGDMIGITMDEAPSSSGNAGSVDPKVCEREELDVLVVGAGLSGICAAYRLATERPDNRFAVLDARDAIGGTWDLFRYPGVRSDSDVQTLGYAFQPWRGERSIVDGPSILDYIRDTAETHGLAERVRLGHRVVAAEWDSAAARWSVRVETHENGTPTSCMLRCRFLFLCTGYYDYENGHAPRWPGMDAFNGRIVHPQNWQEDFDCTGREVVVIGSGATAVTLVPTLARSAERVTMLQRSPSYVVAMPAVDGAANWLARHLPDATAHSLVRWKNILMGIWVYELARRAPDFVKRGIAKAQREALGDDYDLKTHFTPRYEPWDQRLCLAPDGDFFDAIRSNKARVVTDTIERFTPKGLLLESGETLEADVIVTATGLKLKIGGGIKLSVDSQPVRLSQSHSYKGAMFTGVPNLALAAGYTNASWTLKCDLIARYVARLLGRMDRRGWDYAVPEAPPEGLSTRRPLALTSGYVERGLDQLPRQTPRAPWRIAQNYVSDLALLGYGRIGNHMRFGRAALGNDAANEPVPAGTAVDRTTTDPAAA